MCEARRRRYWDKHTAGYTHKRSSDTILKYLTEYSEVYPRRYRTAEKYVVKNIGRGLTGGQYKAWSVPGQAPRDYVEGNISGEDTPRECDSTKIVRAFCHICF